MKKRVKLIGGIILAVIIAAGAVYSAMAPLTLEVKTLEQATAKVTFTEQGNYVYDRNIAIYPQISGEVTEVKVELGAKVRKGDVIAVISANDYERQVKSLESSIAGLEAQIENVLIQERQSKSVLEQTRAGLAGQIAQAEAALADFEVSNESRAKQIEMQKEIIIQSRSIANTARSNAQWARDEYESGALDESQLASYRSAYYQAQAAYEASRQQLEQLEAGGSGKESLEAQKTALESQLALVDKQLGQNTAAGMQKYYESMIAAAKYDMGGMLEQVGKTNITSPIDGVIQNLPILDANLANPQAPVATVSSDPVVEVFVPIREIDGVKHGDIVELILDKRLGNETVTGEVISVGEEAQVRISALGVEERKIRALIKPQNAQIGAGFSMDVRFTVFEQENTVIIPKTAVFEQDGKDYVWAIENGAARLREIIKGVETRDGYAVTSGLAAGEAVVTDANSENLSEGKRIKPAA